MKIYTKLFIIHLCLFQAFCWIKIRYNLDNAMQHFLEFMAMYNKRYATQEEFDRRFNIFKANLEDINRRNKCNGSEYYGITEFTDMTYDEYCKYYTGFLQSPPNMPNDTIPLGSAQEVPEYWDWRDQGAVGPVKDQGPCGSCWIFSAVGVVEGQYGKRNKQVISLSEQQVLDCSSNTNGCAGGWPHTAFQDMAKMEGWDSNYDYQYQAVQGQCRFVSGRTVTKVSGGKEQTTSSEERLKNLVYYYGPLSVSIYASNGFSQYRGGIATAANLGCTGNEINNHAVSIVGYGTEGGVPYWVLKNSYGPRWGEDGYMRIERGNKACGLLQYTAVAYLE